MDMQQQLQDLSHVVSAVANQHRAIHDHINNESGTLKSFLTNLFGRSATNFPSRLADSESLLLRLTKLLDNLSVFEREQGPSLTADQTHYFDVLFKFSDALRQTVSSLVKRQQMLVSVAKGRLSLGDRSLFDRLRRHPPNWKNFKDVSGQYEKAIKAQQAIGKELNDLAPLIFS